MDNDFVCFEEKYTATTTTTDNHPETIGQEPPRQQPIKTKKQPSQPGLARRLHLRCLSPARMLKPYFAASRASVLFSATLTPPGFFQQLLGLQENLTKNRLPSPFGEQSLRVLVAPFINMRSKARTSSLAAITELVATTFRAWPGNYWVYTPSFEYLHKLSTIFAETCPNIELVCQRQGALEDQQDFLQHFTPSSKIIGFTVLGSVFGEGIDMPGDRLIGTIILGPGLPRISLINDSISAYFQQQALAGFAYAYQLPGWQKVVQAAGRVIRTETDRGVVILADDRFTQSSYDALMPPHWHPIVCRNNDDLQTHLTTFWSRQMG